VIDARQEGFVMQSIASETMKPRMKAINIRVKFNGYTVTLPDETTGKTPEWVEIWIQQPANNIRPMADVPTGTLDKYKHCSL
jgi:hypothetical protein